jgi:hypothetical protein
MVWGIVASVICIVLPIVEASDVIFAVCKGKKATSKATPTAEESVQGKEAHLELPPAPVPAPKA